jgi:tetratricopeptide (TPR) repeat protein
MNLTIHLLTKNNENDIEQALQSVIGLDAPILIGDQGSIDNTVEICRKFKIQTIIVPTGDNSAAREILIKNTKTTWAFYIHPWEILAGGHKSLLEIPKENSYLCQIFQNNLIFKEIRLWNITNGFMFHNPVFETLYDSNAKIFKDIIIYSKKPPLTDIDTIKKWKKTYPTSPNPYYYEACVLLQQGKYKDFISIANHYLFLEKEGISSVMLKYYLAMIYCHQLKDYKSAIMHLMPCLAVRPLMAEFWCLLGDIYYQQSNFQKATAFYENAIILGGQRDLLDEWPIEIDKYKLHPQKMIDSWKEIKKSKHYCH